MHVAEAVGELPFRVHVVEPRDRVSVVVDLLAEYGIGAVVVTQPNSGAIAGIISERDIVKHLAREQEGALRVPVEEIMTVNVATCLPGDEITDAIETMLAGHFRHMPIVDTAGDLMGMTSLGDLTRARLAQFTSAN